MVMIIMVTPLLTPGRKMIIVTILLILFYIPTYAADPPDVHQKTMADRKPSSVYFSFFSPSLIASKAAAPAANVISSEIGAVSSP